MHGAKALILQPHPAVAAPPLQAQVLVQRGDAYQLQLQYQAHGDMAQLRVAAPVMPARRDELWKHACAELFVAEPGKPGYCEFNFSPSGEWTAYEFDDYRQGMRSLTCDPPTIDVWHDATTLRMTVQCRLPTSLATAAVFQLGVTMVIEDAQGGLSYWALQHPADKPDFHWRDGFVLEL